eukprot:m.60465 g.60465  ORF g.60465 m.60465 type:complete len:891 (-) comp7945_c2_seq1:248-2920(-)
MEAKESEMFDALCVDIGLDEESKTSASALWVQSRQYFTKEELTELVDKLIACPIYVAIHPDFRPPKTSPKYISISKIFSSTKQSPEEFFQLLERYGKRGHVDEQLDVKKKQMQTPTETNERETSPMATPLLTSTADERSQAMEETSSSSIPSSTPSTMITIDDNNIVQPSKLSSMKHSDIGSLVSSHAQLRLSEIDVSKLCAHYYRTFFDDIFKEADKKAQQDHNVALSIELIRNVTWFLFLTMRTLLPDSRSDLLGSFSILACCLDFAHVNASNKPILLNTEILDQGGVLKYCAKSLKGIDSEALVEDLRIFHEQVFRELLSKIKANCGLKTHGAAGFFFEQIDGSLLPRGTHTTLQHNRKAIHKYLNSIILSKGLVDESLLAITPYAKLPLVDIHHTPSFRRTPKYYFQLRATQSPQRSPIPTKNLPQTANDNINKRKMKDVLEKMGIDELITKQFFTLVDEMREKFMLVTTERFSQRKMVYKELWQSATFIFYDLVESMARIDFMSNTETVIAFLGKQHWMQALISICVERILHANFETAFKFPWVLSTFSVDPCDFIMVVEFSVVHSSDLPLASQDHVADCEINCFNSLVWSDSAYFHAKVPPFSVQPIQAFPNTEAKSPEESSQSKYDSQDGSIIAYTKDGTDVFNERLSLFIQDRFNKLRDRLELSEEDAKDAYRILFKCIFDGNVLYDLLEYKYFDTLLLCCIYIGAKTEIPMRYIIKQYGHLEESTIEAYSHIPKDNSTVETMSINTYYNLVFLPAADAIVTAVFTSEPDDDEKSSAGRKKKENTPYNYNSTYSSPELESLSSFSSPSCSSLRNIKVTITSEKLMPKITDTQMFSVKLSADEESHSMAIRALNKHLLENPITFSSIPSTIITSLKDGEQMLS